MSETALNKDVLIQANALNRFYGDYHAVRDFNLSLKKGEILGLLGPNGAGKSTTMQMLTGNISPSSGNIFIDQVDLIEAPEIAKSGIGYLPEQPPVYRDMTVAEYLTYCAALRGISKAQRNAQISETSERCGLQDVSNKLIQNLSKGFQQRVGIAQAILHKPKLVIFDEPTVGLDPLQINQIRQLIRELGRDHAVILSTHILPEVQAVCDRVQIINHGETVFADSFAKVKVLESGLKQSRFELSFKQNENVQNNAAKLYQLSVEQGWELIELSPQNETLEQIFMDLVYSDSKQHQNSASNSALEGVNE